MYVEGKVALITGSASGLGLVYAKELLKNGLRGVTLTDVNVSVGKKAAEDLNKTYGKNKAIFVKVDVVNKNEVENAMKKTVETFGNFDILINNAGIMTDAIWEKEIDINIKGLMYGCFLGMEEYLPKYKTASSEPTIVNIASIAGYITSFFMPVYCGTKAAVIHMTRSLAEKENYDSQKVRLLALCPGATLTPLLENLETRSFTERHSNVLKTFFEANSDMIKVQEPKVAGEAMIKLLETGVNGQVWVIEGGKFSELKPPNPMDV